MSSQRLSGATSRGHTMAPEGQKPSQWLCLTQLPRAMYSQPIVHKALSWGAIRKSACILAEITRRKSHPLEGSCQEAILLPFTTFAIVPVVCRSAHSPPLGSRRRLRVFILVASVPMRRPSHPSGSRPLNASLCRQTSAPGICMPQKTLGSLPCPILYSVQITWLPHGSNFNRAHGRGVAPRGHAAAGHL